MEERLRLAAQAEFGGHRPDVGNLGHLGQLASPLENSTTTTPPPPPPQPFRSIWTGGFPAVVGTRPYRLSTLGTGRGGGSSPSLSHVLDGLEVAPRRPEEGEPQPGSSGAGGRGGKKSETSFGLCRPVLPFGASVTGFPPGSME